MKTAWFALLMSTICFEGLGRRYLPQVRECDPPVLERIIQEHLVGVQTLGLFQEARVAARHGEVGTAGSELGHGASGGRRLLPKSIDACRTPLTRS